ncbi:MAG: methyltransferase [Clostridia bacterium]|nr:methyltransferase [Clostridia bacterium]
MMNGKEWIHENETLEDLQLNGLKLLQKKDGFRFGMDSVLLAHFASIRPDETVADFGTGSGIIPLLLIGRGKGKHFFCIEIQKELAEMADRTVRINSLEERMEIICGDVADTELWLPSCSVDSVVCNPPYGIPGKVLASPNETRAISRSQQENALDRFFHSAFRILKGKGRIFLVYPASQMFSMMIQLRKNHLEPKRFRLVYPYINRPANLVLLEAVKDARPTLHPLPPLIIYEDNQILTNELKSVYHIKQNPV